MAIDFFNLHVHYSAKMHDNTAIVSFDAADTDEIPDDINRFSIGLHPWSVTAESLNNDLRKVAFFAENSRCAAIGECGLVRIKWGFPEPQTEAFIRQIEIANSAKKPLIIHARSAERDAMEILLEYNMAEKDVLFHCYTGDIETAEVVLSHGWYISISVIATFKKSDDIREILCIIPDNRLLLETDSPFLTPTPLR